MMNNASQKLRQEIQCINNEAIDDFVTIPRESTDYSLWRTTNLKESPCEEWW